MKRYKKAMEMKMGGLLDLKKTEKEPGFPCSPSKDIRISKDDDSQAERDLQNCLEECVQVDHLFRSEPFEN